MAQVTNRKPRITKWQPDDLFIRVAYTQGNGECVEASFAHVGWLVPPLRPLRPFAVQQRTGYGSIFEPVNPQVRRPAAGAAGSVAWAAAG